DDAVFKGVFLLAAFQLQHQAFAQVARANTSRVEGLNNLEDFGKFFDRRAGRSRQFLQRRLEVTVIVDIPNQSLRDGPLTFRQIGFANLLEQHFLQRSRRHDGIEHELAPFLVFGGSTNWSVRLRKMIPPLLIELNEFFEFSLEIVNRGVRIFRFFSRRVKIQVGRGFRGVGRGFGRSLAIGTDALLQVGFGRGSFLEDGVLLQFLLNQRFEFEGGSLKQRERLLELGRQYQRLRQPL